MAEQKLQPISVRTDLAVEAHQILASGSQTVPGVHVSEYEDHGTTVTRVEVEDEQGAKLMNKPIGMYVTIEESKLRHRDKEVDARVSKLLVQEVVSLLDLKKNTKVLIVGLGNWNATPDALGPKVVERLIVTRHLEQYAPDELDGSLRSLAAIAPGVLGITGIETGEIVAGVVDRIKPDVVVAIDALASRSVNRIATTIQLANTGIHPGSGVGNHRKSLSRDTLGVPVIAIGVPTVVHALTIAKDTLDHIFHTYSDNPSMSQSLRELDENEVIHSIWGESVSDLMVTPKEIDQLITDLSDMIAAAINAAVHPGIDVENMERYN